MWFVNQIKDFAHKLWESFKQGGLSLVFAVIALLVGIVAINIIMRIARNASKKNKLNPTLNTFLISLLKIVLYIILFIIIAGILGIPVSSFLVILGSVSVAVGLACQNILSSFLGGLMLLASKPFQIGDYVEFGSQAGTVKKISMFYTVFSTPDNKRIVVPNKDLANAAITNYSAQKTRRVDLLLKLEHNTDVQLAKTVSLEVLNAHPLVLQEPKKPESDKSKKSQISEMLTDKEESEYICSAPLVRLYSITEHSLEFVIRVWTETADYWTVYFDLCEQILQAFRARGIKLAIPQVKVNH